MKTIAFFKKQLQKPVVTGSLLVLLTFIAALIIRGGSADEVAAPEQPTRLVEVAAAAELTGQENLSLIGTVRAFTEAQITSERAGRVTRVNTTLGATVRAGQIIATLENSAEQASVLQAQGGYEAALAAVEQSQFGNQQSVIGVQEAQTRLSSARDSGAALTRTAYTTVEGIVLNNTDQFFSNPRGFVPGLRLDGTGFTSELNQARIAYQTSLPTWKQRSDDVTRNSNVVAELEFTSRQVAEAQVYVDRFIAVMQRQEPNSRYTAGDITTFSSTFTSLRNNLIALQNQIDAAQSAITAAEESISRADLTVESSTDSAAQAQVTQALGSLRAAQSNLAKTILRSPITGTVNLLDIQTGDFVGSFERVAIVANNNALEIVTFVGDLERDQLVVGDTVLIEGAFEGTITTIAPAVDEATKKTEVRIATDNPNISNGDTVRISKTSATLSPQVVETIQIPLTAVKFENVNGFIMQVENGVVVQKAVELGPVRGTTIEIVNGLTIEDQFVVDVRGLTPGTAVTVRN